MKITLHFCFKFFWYVKLWDLSMVCKCTIGVGSANEDVLCSTVYWLNKKNEEQNVFIINNKFQRSFIC